MIFYKYHGTGNDFILVDNREQDKQLSRQFIAHLCKRNFGIGADGLILLENHDQGDFYMRYYNSDGNLSTMCGNGARCCVLFAQHIGVLTNDETNFYAADGLHYAKLLENNVIALEMNVNPQVEINGKAYIIDTGSPHYVRFVYNIDSINVKREGRIVRNSAQFKENGINVNFVEETNAGLFVRTYERGVENETLSCGTGVTAAAIAQFKKLRNKGNQIVPVQTLGGKLQIQIEAEGSNIEKIWLIGPAQEVFIGEVDID